MLIIEEGADGGGDDGGGGGGVVEGAAASTRLLVGCSVTVIPLPWRRHPGFQFAMATDAKRDIGGRGLQQIIALVVDD